MPDTHLIHDHIHGINCGHTVVRHENYADYLVNGHLHHQHNSHYGNHGPVLFK